MDLPSQFINTPAAGEPNDRSFEDFASRQHQQELLAGKLYSSRRTPVGLEIVDRRASAGCWNNMTFSIWGPGVELTIDPLYLALNNQVKMYANLLCDVGVRYPAAFAVTAPVT